MIKVAVLDDYQNVFEEIINIENYQDKFEFTIFNEAFESEEAAIIALDDFNCLFIMRERTPITKNIIKRLSKLKYIMTSGMRNNSIDLTAAKENNIIEIVNNESNLVIFFKNGLILEINYLTGEIINDIDLNINHINKIDFYNQYLIVYQNNGKFSIFIQ